MTTTVFDRDHDSLRLLAEAESRRLARELARLEGAAPASAFDALLVSMTRRCKADVDDALRAS